MYYPNAVQPGSAGFWPNGYPIATQQQQAVPAMYYQVPTTTVPEIVVQQPQQQVVPTAYYQMPELVVQQPQQQQIIPSAYYQMPEVIVQQSQQAIPTTYYQPPTMTGPPIVTTNPSEGTVQQPPTNTTTTTKTVTTRVLDPPTTAPAVETTTVEEKIQTQPRGLRTGSTSTSSDISTTSTESTITPVPEPIRTNPILPPVLPIHTTTTMPPVHRVIHRPYTPSGYVSSELDYGRRKVYKTDYKYRHYYCCNICKGRFDLRNRSYSCCEWFYGCPVWCLLLLGILFLGLLAAFFTLFGLQPTLNSSRRDATAETRLLNRTQIVYGFYQNCGFHINATVDTPTTLILCTNTATTTTARVQLSPFYTVISGTNVRSFSQILILFCFVSIWQITAFSIRT